MATCEVCGNDYDKCFTVASEGESHTFDSFECAIHALAPQCDHCGGRRSSGTASSKARCIAARLAPGRRAFAVWWTEPRRSPPDSDRLMG